MVIDTNIVIDYLRGVPEAQNLLKGRKNLTVSAVTFAEVLSGAPRERFEELKRVFRNFRIEPVGEQIAEVAAILRREFKLTKLRLPDALILATAKFMEMELVTRDKQLDRIAKKVLLPRRTI